MRKRIISLILMTVMIITMLPIMSVSAATTISIGDYVQMGTYYGKPIIWRCVNIDENGPLMLSDKIICIKPFDVRTSANSTTGSHSRNSYRDDWGSNYWADSNMRSWLNSSASAGNVEWLCGNPPIESKVWSGYNEYDQEAGFLSNFTSTEKSAIKPVTQKSIVAYPEYENGIYTEGSESHTYKSSIANVVSNYDDAYAERVTDTVFLLDVKQVNKVYQNSNILGDEYYIGEPTQEAVDNSEYKSSSLTTGKKWYYWLRSPDADRSSHFVRCVYSDGIVGNDGAYYRDPGVRPAFYLNQLSVIYKSGNGSQTNPYVIDGNGTTGGGDEENDNDNTEIGTPVIKSATLTHDGDSYDIFTQTVNIEKDSEVDVNLNVEVDNNGCNNVKTYITQGAIEKKNNFEIPSTGLTFKPGQLLSSDKRTYIIAIDETTGKSSAKEIKLKITYTKDGDFLPDSGVDGLNFKLGKDVGFTLPDSVPVFGGTEINWAFDFIPLSVEYDREDNNKINIVFGTNIVSEEYTKDGVKTKYFKDFDFEKYKKDFKHAVSKSNRTFKQLRNDFKMSNACKMNMFGGNLVGGGSGKGGGDLDVCGYAEMHIIDGKPVFSEGQLCVNAEIKYTYQGQIFIWVVPLYYEFGGGVGAGLEGNMVNVNPNGFTPEFDAYVTAKVMAEIGGGLGIAGVATAGANGNGSLNIKTGLNRSYIKAWGEGEANFNVKLFGKEVAKKVFAKGDFLIYETGNANGLIKGDAVSLSSDEDEGIYKTIDINQVYENESREYLNDETIWTGEAMAELADIEYSNKDFSVLANNVYTETAPQICEAGGKKIMVMQWDNSARPDSDRSMLVYSIYDDVKNTWSEPVAVNDDNTADFYPSFKDGWLVWQNQKAKISDNDTLADIAKNGEILAAKWNGNGFDTPIKITDNSVLDTLPSVSANGDTITVVWVQNSANDILGITGTNLIMSRNISGGTLLDAAVLKTNINAVMDLTTSYSGGKLYTAYVPDGDNDLNTIADRDVYVISPSGEAKIGADDVLDDNPIIFGDKLYRYSGGNIAYCGLDGSNEQTVFEEAIYGITDTFVIDENSSGDACIWWAKTQNSATEVYAVLSRNGEWSEEVQITDLKKKAKYPSGLLNDDGTMITAFTISDADNSETAKTDLYTVAVTPSYNLEIVDSYIDESNLKVYATVKNSGELAVDSFEIAIYENGAVNNSMQITEPLKAGESCEVVLEYLNGGNIQLGELTFNVSSAGIDEYNTTDNSVVFTIGHSDVVVSNVAVNEENGCEITADITNEGYSKASGIVVSLRDENSNGEVIEKKTISLDSGETYTVEFDVDKSELTFMNDTKFLYVTAETETEEVSVGNNDGYAYITSLTGEADYTVDLLNYGVVGNKCVVNAVAANNTKNSVDCDWYVAVTDENGLKDVGVYKGTMDANSERTIDVELECVVESGDTITVYMWETDTLRPLSLISQSEIQ